MTKDQAKILQYIKDCGDVTPTYREMAAHLGRKSWGGIRAIVDALVLRGELERFEGKSRGLRAMMRSREWLPIDTAPAKGKKRIMARLAAGKTVVGYRCAGAKTVRPDFSDKFFLATHWMPLPDAPHE